MMLPNSTRRSASFDPLPGRKANMGDASKLAPPYSLLLSENALPIWPFAESAMVMPAPLQAGLPMGTTRDPAKYWATMSSLPRKPPVHRQMAFALTSTAFPS